MDDQYDVIIIGSGLRQAMLAAIFSLKGKKVLRIGN